jgi:hypothetical protein
VTLGNGSTLDTASSSLLDNITMSGNGATLNDGGSGDTLTLSGASDTATLTGGNVNAAGVTISGAGAPVEFTGATNDNIAFGSGASGVLKLDAPAGFVGTVAGMADGDGIDLSGFLFSGAPTISKVTGTGAAGTATDLTITDGAQTAVLALLNQYASQFAESAAYLRGLLISPEVAHRPRRDRAGRRSAAPSRSCGRSTRSSQPLERSTLREALTGTCSGASSRPRVSSASRSRTLTTLLRSLVT